MLKLRFQFLYSALITKGTILDYNSTQLVTTPPQSLRPLIVRKGFIDVYKRRNRMLT
jgi:hypothetical protein